MSSSAPPIVDRFEGCLLGCAVGDALGAPFEGLWPESIPDAEALLREFAEFEGYPRGQYTDDTQLTVATVEAIVEARGLEPERVARAIASSGSTTPSSVPVGRAHERPSPS